jgi:hypothetical protein
MNQNYIDTVRLLLAMAPSVFASGRFAMKGGTALNLFVQEMPRLSVDIDLVFVDHRPDRQAALQTIAHALAAVQTALAGKSPMGVGIDLRMLLAFATECHHQLEAGPPIDRSCLRCCGSPHRPGLAAGTRRCRSSPLAASAPTGTYRQRCCAAQLCHSARWLVNLNSFRRSNCRLAYRSSPLPAAMIRRVAALGSCLIKG